MDLVVTVLLTAIILGLLIWVLSRSAMSRYRTTRRKTLLMLEGVVAGRTPEAAWELFVSHPIAYDEELEAIRRRCVRLQEGDEEVLPARSGLGNHIFNREGREQVACIAEDLRALIASEPYRRFF